MLRVGLFKFTTASLSIPAGATLNEVFVQMFLDPTSTAANGDQLRLYESTCFTSEDTVTWNTHRRGWTCSPTRDLFNQSGTLRPSVTFSYTDLTALNTGSPTCFWVESTNAATTVEVESHENGDTAKQAVLWVDYTTSGTTTTTQPTPGGTKVMAAGDLCDPDVQVPTNNPTCQGPADLVTTYNEPIPPRPAVPVVACLTCMFFLPGRCAGTPGGCAPSVSRRCARRWAGNGAAY
jgi:hypothetical protein